MSKFILLILLVRCATINTYKNVEISDFMYPVKRFEKHYGKKIEYIHIKFDDLRAYRSWNTMGICNYDTEEIRIDLHWWNEIGNPLYKESLILHELGHCVLFRDHRNGKLKDGCPISLMSEHIVSYKCARKYRDYYIKELMER